VAQDHFLVGAALEGHDTCQELIGDDTEAVEIGALVCRPFRCEICRCAQKGGGACDSCEIEALGDTEVGDLGDSIGADQDVGGLEVAMDHARGMGIGETLGDLGQ
jgi:hypothetical protein